MKNKKTMLLLKARLFARNWPRIRILAGGMLLALAAAAQPQAGEPTPSAKKPGVKSLNVQEEIANIKAGIITPYGLNFLGESKAREAIPGLEEQFALAGDEIDRAQIAQVLVQLKAPRDTYWNYLVKLITPILDSHAPDPFASDAEGKELPGVSPAFEAWVDANRLDPPTALQNATIVYPGYVTLLGETEDPRAVSMLCRALTSPNYLIAAQASEGLALLKDEGAIPLIADAARKAPASAARSIAEPLVYFANPDAQAAFDRFVPAEQAQRLRERVRQGGRPLHQ
jgi:hypothetical protein